MNNKQQMMDNLLLFPEKEDDSIKYYKQIIPITIHHFYITEAIGDVSKYLEMIQTLRTAEQHDTIFIYLNTEGGLLNTAIQIMTAIKQSNATIITCLEGEVCSAGTMIFLAADKYLVNPNCTFMIHNYSGGVVGKGNEIAAQAEYRGQYARSLMKDVYTDFLTQTEIDAVIEGKDIWLNSEQVIERLGKRAKDTSELDVQKLVEKIPTLLEKLITDDTDEFDEIIPMKKPKVKPKTAPKKKVTPKKK